VIKWTWKISGQFGMIGFQFLSEFVINGMFKWLAVTVTLPAI